MKPQFGQRKPITVTLAPDVLRALQEKASAIGLPLSRVVDAVARKALQLPPPVERNPLDVEPSSAA